MQEHDEMQGVLLNLLAQVQANLSRAQQEEVERLVTAGRHAEAVETVCRFAHDGRYPVPTPARAMVFKLADRLGIDPAQLGMLDWRPSEAFHHSSPDMESFTSPDARQRTTSATIPGMICMLFQIVNPTPTGR